MGRCGKCVGEPRNALLVAPARLDGMPTDWERRFTAASILEARWSHAAPDRLGIVSTASGAVHVWAWDLSSGSRRRVSTGGVGAEEVHVTPGGDGIVWWLDHLGDERGRWVLSPFDEGPSRPLLDVPDAWMAGLSMVPGATAAGYATDDGYVIYVAHGSDSPRLIYRNEAPAGVGLEWPQGAGGLSADGAMLCIRHAEDGDISHFGVRVLDARSGATVAELQDADTTIAPAGWSPVPGDGRLILIREITGWGRPWLWEPQSGTLEELRIDAPGAVSLMDWYPGGDALLLRQDHEARHALLRFGFDPHTSTTLRRASGTISQASVRPDGAIWLREEDSVHPPAFIDLQGDVVLAIPGAATAPRGRPYESVWFSNPQGDAIQGWVVLPEGNGPFPTIVSVHGGPEYHNTDAFDARRQAFVDHGFATLLVNYRGSTGYGVAFRQALQGNIGFPETEDLNAALDHLIAVGIADPDNLFIEGWSWGGYLATLNAGLHPDRWRAVCAGIPVGDYVAAHYECAPALRAWDLAVMGGSPMDLPELYHERNPMTYIDAVRAPILLIAGEHDSRCPLGQVMTYAHGLRARGREVEVHTYPGGHHANDVAEQILHVRLTMDHFLHNLASYEASEAL
jgi:dipeptidyl aminopeptidase/acylaminoacyl peptidase